MLLLLEAKAAATAAAVTLLGSTFNTASGYKEVTATPAEGDLIIIVTAHTGSLGGDEPYDNRGGGIYPQICSALKASSQDLMVAYVAPSLVTAARAVSTVYASEPTVTSGGGLAVFKVTGMLRYGLSAIRQSAVQSNQAAAGTPTPVLGAAAQTENPMIGVVFNATNPATMTPRTSWTEQVDTGYATPTTGLEAMSRDSGETASSIAWGGTSASEFASLVVELDTRANTDLTLALTGLGLSVARGTLTASRTLALTGRALSVSPGVLGLQATLALTGQAVTVAGGIIAQSTALALAGQALTVAKGTVTVPSSDVTVALTGHAVGVAQGVMAGATSLALTGRSVAVGQGSLAPAVSLALTGQGVAAARGVVGGGTSVALTGQFVTAARGSVSPTYNVVLTGVEATVSKGVVSVFGAPVIVRRRQFIN